MTAPMHDAAAWTEVSKGVFEAFDYRIVGEQIESVWVYVAWAPPFSELTFDQLCKVHYRVGERVPQRRQCLGVFALPASARLACSEHYNGPVKT